MQYEFDKRVDRTGMASIRELATPKVISDAGFISFWGAEFEFKTAPCVTEAIKKWVDQGLIAYCEIDDKYLELVQNWMKFHRNWEIKKDWIVSTYGLTASVGTMCRAFTDPGDGIIGMDPVYHMTWRPIELNDRVHVNCPLLYDGSKYSIQFDLLEELMAQPKNKILTICNPHNPIGKVWGREDLERIAALAIKYDVIIYSDEIFADTVYEGVEMLTLSQVTEQPVKWIVATSIGKTFSITGIGQANIIIENLFLREAFIKQRDIDHYGSFNPMMRAAYFGGYTSEGQNWIRQMMKYCFENYRLIDTYLKEYIPQMTAIKPEGTYILWLDCTGFKFETEEEYDSFFRLAYFYCDHGTTYGSKPGFLRMNLAAPRADINRALESLRNHINSTIR